MEPTSGLEPLTCRLRKAVCPFLVPLPVLEKYEIEWHDYHAFRRGLSTNLHALKSMTIIEILRHWNVAVTRASYIKRVDEKSVEAMGRLEAEIRKPVRSVKTRKADIVVPVGMA